MAGLVLLGCMACDNYRPTTQGGPGNLKPKPGRYEQRGPLANPAARADFVAFLRNWETLESPRRCQGTPLNAFCREYVRTAAHPEWSRWWSDESLRKLLPEKAPRPAEFAELSTGWRIPLQGGLTTLLATLPDELGSQMLLLVLLNPEGGLRQVDAYPLHQGPLTLAWQPDSTLLLQTGPRKHQLQLQGNGLKTRWKARPSEN